MSDGNSTINTGGGAGIGGDVNPQGDFVNRDKITNVILPANIQRTGSAPPRPLLMIGREDALRDLKTRLGIAPGGQVVPAALQALTAVRGWPGVGKTTIAAALAHDPDVMTAFPDGVLWASLGPQPDLFSQLAAWGRGLNTDEIGKARTLEEASAQLTALLRAQKRLLIVDDVWQAEHALPFKVGGRNCAILVTTRIPGVAQALAPAANDIYWLPVLTDEKALELLQELAPAVVAENPKAALELAHELMGLPLALQVAGRLLNVEAAQGFGVSNLLAELRDGAKLLESEAPAELADLAKQITPTVVALLQKSTGRMDEQTRACFARLGVFAPTPASIDLAAMQAVWQVGDPRPIARALMQRGLLEYVPERKCYQMHALLHQYGKTLLTEKEAAEARQNHFAFFQAVAKNYDPGQQDRDKMQEFELFYPQMMQTFVNFEKAQGLADLKTQNERLQQMLQLVDKLDKYWTLHSHFDDQVRGLKVAYECADTLNDTLKQADFARRVGRVLSQQGHLDDALVWMERCKTALGEDQSAAANAIRALMYIHRASLGYQKGALEMAEKDCMRGLEMVTEKGQPTIYAEGYNILGAIKLGANKLPAAREAFEKSLSTWKQIGDPYQIQRVGDNVRSVRYYLGDVAYLRKADQESLQYWEQFPDRIEYAMSLTNRADVHYFDEEFESAVKLYQRAIEIIDRIEAQQMRVVARHGLAQSHISLGEHEQAQALLDEILKIQEKSGIMEYRIDTCLAEVQMGRKNYAKAIEILEAALETAREEADALEEGVVLRILGQAYELNGNFKPAGVSLRKSLSLLRRNKHKYESYLTLRALADYYVHTGATSKAQAASAQAQALAREMGLPGSPKTLSDTN